VVEPTFTSCFVDEDKTLYTETIGKLEFRLRGITAGEHARIQDESVSRHVNAVSEDHLLSAYASAVNKEVEELTPDERKAATMYRLSERTDIHLLMILTVAAALGAYKTFGGEGWSSTRPVTIDTVKLLRKEFIDRLFTAHQKFFRGQPGPAPESGESDPLVVHEANGQLVPSER